MDIFTKTETILKHVGFARRQGQSIGFVPTMGALHQGHVSLLEAARAQADLVVCSIFVNPTQFNDPNDYKKYPVTTDRDIALLEQTATNVLFLPSVEEIYPGGTARLEHYDLGGLEDILEGKYRPDHFQGVCQVMRRLLEATQPDHLFMGQKDYQQCMVVQCLLAQMNGGSSINLHICPTVREPDGLAMSSRNMRLDATAREKAAMLPAALNYVKANLQPGDLLSLLLHARSMLTAQRMKVDYLEIADAKSLQPVDNWDGKQKLVALVAAFLGEVRLIDNMPLN